MSKKTYVEADFEIIEYLVDDIMVASGETGTSEYELPFIGL